MKTNDNKLKIVVSALNSFGGGALSVTQDCLQALKNHYQNEVEIIAFVYDKNLINIDGIEFYEFKKKKCKRVQRLYYEYFYFLKFSKKIKPYLWLSLADVTPNVEAEIRAVYCHNLAPFYKIRLQDAIFDPIMALYHYFFKFLYQKNIKKNKAVIVQQQSLGEIFTKTFNIKNVLVAIPQLDYFAKFHVSKKDILTKETDKIWCFFYPSVPRVFKNFEIIAEATKILLEKKIENFKVILTINGIENRYSKYILKKYGNLNQLLWVGAKTRKEIFDFYQQTDALIFPSKFETWGMAISEAKALDIPILLVDEPYSIETVGKYDKVAFFKQNSALELATIMQDLIENKIVFDKTEEIIYQQPYAKNWKEIFEYLEII